MAPPNEIRTKTVLSVPIQRQFLVSVAEANLALAGEDRMHFDQLKRRKFITLLGGRQLCGRSLRAQQPIADR